MLDIRDAVNNFVDYVDHAYQGRLYYEMTRGFGLFCGPLRKPDSETVGVGMTIGVDYNSAVPHIDPYGSQGAYYTSPSWQQPVEVIVILENGHSSNEVKYHLAESNRLTEFLSVFACFMCLDSEHYIASPELFKLIPDNVDLSYIIRVIEIDHNVELMGRMIEDIYHYCKDGSYKEHIRAMLDHFTSTEHNDPELTAVILNKMYELGIANEASCFYI